MNKFRFRDYDALGLRARIPGDTAPNAHHISKRKQKQKDVEVVFDAKDYKEYVTGFRKRKQQRRQDAMKQIQDKARQDRNEQRTQKRNKLKEELGLGDNYGVEDSSDEERDETDAAPQHTTVYQGDGGVTTTVNIMALESSEDEPMPGEEDGGEGGEDGGEELERGRNSSGAGPRPGSKRQGGIRAARGGGSGKRPGICSQAVRRLN
ncbi:hypothetical protein CHLRE_03g183500v5 [Chlamydomonas reinhardtii]|uniref:Nucleolar protein 12 n=1 Tax=Chlamydomonas reinhardtii TaxID=3055 RepID=A0A2K3DXW4_CHLRE|nr:uncharacterized protein CHLRE_03g183500v5 [Chlamydomonas reinhardtii]PNW85376.1 hypothetical protein CHLRE_03g183500v5 [Chlamydomonas reinhardtii]